MNLKDILSAPFDLVGFLAKNTWDELLVKGGSSLFNYIKQNPQDAKDAFNYLKTSLGVQPTDPRIKDILTAALRIMQRRNGNLHARISQRLEEIETGTGGSEEKLHQVIVRIIPVPDNLADRDQRLQAAEETADILEGFARLSDPMWQQQLTILEEQIVRERSAWERFQKAYPETADNIWRGVKSAAGDVYEGGKRVLGEADNQARETAAFLQANRQNIRNKLQRLGGSARNYLNEEEN